MAAIVVLGLMLTMASRVWSFSEQRDKEAQLLYVGDQYRLAIGRYYTFGGRYPLDLHDLLEDKRTPVPRRYLRQLYRDPLTGEADWLLIKDPTNTFITGIASRAKGVPIKRAGFDKVEFGFDDRDCYCDWKFVYTPPSWYRRQPMPLPGQLLPGQSVPGQPLPGASPPTQSLSPRAQ